MSDYVALLLWDAPPVNLMIWLFIGGASLLAWTGHWATYRWFMAGLLVISAAISALAWLALNDPQATGAASFGALIVAAAAFVAFGLILSISLLAGLAGHLMRMTFSKDINSL